MKNKILKIGLLLLLVIFFVKVFGINANHTNGISANKILAVKIGMSENDIEKLLGKPFKTEKTNDNRTTYFYSKPVKLAESYPMLWVHFDKNLKVCEVYAKRYKFFGCDDEGIYGLSKNQKQWIDKSKFFSYFR